MTSRSQLAALGFALLAAALPAAARAQQPGADRAADSIAPGARPVVGAARTVIELDSVPLGAVHTLSQLLASRFPGMVVLPGSGVLAAGAQVVVRGPTSILLGSDPLIVVDGIRVDGDTFDSSLEAGAQRTSRLDDLDLATIERVELLPGPAAAAMYGTGAANGAIIVTTRAGVRGRPRWRADIEGGAIRLGTHFPSSFTRRGTLASDGSQVLGCTITIEVAGVCAPVAGGGLTSWNPLETASPFDDGSRQSLGLSLSGGGAAGTYFLSGTYRTADDVLESSALRATTVHATLATRVRDQLSLRLAGTMRASAAQLPQSDTSVFSILGNGLLGNALLDPARGGYLAFTPEQADRVNARQDVRRGDLSLSARWRARTWLAVNAVGGVDRVDRHERERQPPETFDLDLPFEQRFLGDARFTTWTARIFATADYAPRASWRLATTAGFEYVRRRATIHDSTLATLGMAFDTNVSDTRQLEVTYAPYVQQSAVWRDRVTATAGLRRDENAQPSTRLRSVVLPSASLVWDVGRETFFPERLASALRLRAAYGEATRTPAASDLRFFERVGGNRPELTRELEVGLDAAWWHDRIALSLTRYERISRDVFVPVPDPAVAPFVFLRNDARIRNTGFDASVSARVIERASLRWRLGVLFSHNHNVVDALGVGPINVGPSQWVAVGQPLGSYFARRVIAVHDDNGDGKVSLLNCPGAPASPSAPPCEIDMGPPGFVGPAIPPTTVALSSRVNVGPVALGMLVDHQGGAKQIDLTELFRCNFGVCRADFDPRAPLADQARASIDLFTRSTNAASTLDIVDASFWRLRELSATIDAPARVAARLGASRASLTLAGRNLALWSDYPGFDPEVNGALGRGLGRADFFTQPLTREYTVRVNVAW
ncbi:MAG TPA: TonB-dependent receptor [Gemmatimonadaceae bacterium]|nr:TonB-dependent receptor [Gemmatimonadaceae bacterium]